MTSRTLSKEKIIAAAIELINEQNNLTFTNLGKKLGTKSQSIYNYYPDVLAVKIAVAISFYHDLKYKLQTDLLGLSGKEAVIKFCETSVSFQLSKYLVTQEVFSIPSGKINSKELDRSALDVHDILIKLLTPLEANEKIRLILARTLRNLITGEVIHVGNGRFSDELVSAKESFDYMLANTLNAY
ncbi:TetR/AcrR family transcriptional regulator [Companilactobacillus sp. HBUAS56257]|uniref:TetR/AcrR family transcriptional regulator n=1 Tax=Companilactobacillus sp. HBUAS56257 TaxID=3109360 RepID=UPI002FEE816D